MAFFIILVDSPSSGVGSSKEKKIKKQFHTPEMPKIRENFWIEILKIPQDFDSSFFDFSHLWYEL